MTKDLLRRYIEGQVTDIEIEEVVEWLNTDLKNVEEYETLFKLYYMSLFNTSMYEEQHEPKTSRSILFRKVGIEMLKIASALLLFIAAKHIYDITTEDSAEIIYSNTIYMPAGQRGEILLPDSTKVWLNTKSRITYPTVFAKDSREIILEGEAYFDVKHNSEYPFVVKTSTINIKVLGTEFNVIDYPESSSSEVTLLQGKVELLENGKKQTRVMHPNERVKIVDGEILTIDIQESDYFKWRDGLLCFKNESVEEIFNKMELYFAVKIKVERTDILNSRYSGKFRIDDGVEQMLQILRREHNFKYIRDNNLNVITIK